MKTEILANSIVQGGGENKNTFKAGCIAIGLIGWYCLFASPLMFISFSIIGSRPGLGDLLGALAMGAVVVGTLRVARSVWGANWRRALPLSSVTPRVFLWTGMCVLALLPLTMAMVAIVGRVLGLHGMSEPTLPMGFWTKVLGAPIAEEVLFRGYGLSRLREICGDRRALLLTALVFALGHTSIARLPDTLAFGILMGWLVIRTGSLWPAILGHCTLNLSALILDRLCPFDSKLASGPLILILAMLGLSLFAFMWVPQVRRRMLQC